MIFQLRRQIAAATCYSYIFKRYYFSWIDKKGFEVAVFSIAGVNEREPMDETFCPDTPYIPCSRAEIPCYLKNREFLVSL
jgi:hypothetical protein